MITIVQINIFIDHETDERSGSVGCDSIGSIELIDVNGKIISDDLDLIGQYYQNMDEEEVIERAKTKGYNVIAGISVNVQ